MTRILIDCTLIDFQRQPTGIPRVVLKYVEEAYLWADNSGNEIIPVVPTPDGFYLCRPVPGHDPPPELVELERASQVYDSQKPLDYGDTPPHLVQIREGDIVFSPSYWHDNDPQFYLDAKAAGAKIVILVHDILPVTHKNYYKSPWRYSFAAALLNAISYADQLLCVSKTTMRAVEDFAKRRGKTISSIGVAYNGFQDLVSPQTAERMRMNQLRPHSTDSAVLSAFESEGPLLMVGSIEPKKGHIPVIRCLEAMWAAGYSRNLIIIGRTGWLEREIVECIENSPYLGSRLFWLSGIDDHDLALAYIKSRALVFASIAEGFGIPMIEAATLRKPVVVFDTAIAREVLGDHGRYFTEASELIQHLIDLEDDETYRSECERLVNFSWFAWEECVSPIMDAMVGSD